MGGHSSHNKHRDTVQNPNTKLEHSNHIDSQMEKDKKSSQHLDKAKSYGNITQLMNKFIFQYKLNSGLGHLMQTYDESHETVTKDLEFLISKTEKFPVTNGVLKAIQIFLPAKDRSSREISMKEEIQAKLITSNISTREFFQIEYEELRKDDSFIKNIDEIIDSITKRTTSVDELSKKIAYAMNFFSKFNNDMDIAYKNNRLYRPEFLFKYLIMPLIEAKFSKKALKYENTLYDNQSFELVCAILQEEEHFYVVYTKGDNLFAIEDQFNLNKTTTEEPKSLEMAILVKLDKAMVNLDVKEIFANYKFQQIKNKNNNCWYATAFYAAALSYLIECEFQNTYTS